MGDKINVKTPSAKGKVEGILKDYLNQINVIPDEKEIKVTATMDDKASKQISKLESNLESASDAAKTLDSNVSNIGNKSNKNIRKTVRNISHEFDELQKYLKDKRNLDLAINAENLDNDPNNKIGKQINKNLKAQADVYIKSAQSAIKDYKQRINSAWELAKDYDAKGKHVSALYMNGNSDKRLYDENEVNTYAHRFLKALYKSGKTIGDGGEIQKQVFKRERLYSAFKSLEKEIDLNDTNFSDPKRNVDRMNTLSKMVQIAKHIQYIDKNIGHRNPNRIIDIKPYEHALTEMHEQMLKDDVIGQAFSKQLKIAQSTYDIFFKYLKEGFGDFGSLDATKFLEDMTNAAKNAGKEVAIVADELKEAKTYLSDTSAIKSKASNAYQSLRRGQSKKIRSFETQYEFVGQIANAIRNGKEYDADDKGYKYYLQLLKDDADLQRLANEILNEKTSTPTVSQEKVANLEKETEARRALREEMDRSKQLGADSSQERDKIQELNNKSLEERIQLLRNMKKAATEWHKYDSTHEYWTDSDVESEHMNNLEEKYTRYNVRVKYKDGTEGIFDEGGKNYENWASANKLFREQIDLRKKIVDVVFEESDAIQQRQELQKKEGSSFHYDSSEYERNKAEKDEKRRKQEADDYERKQIERYNESQLHKYNHQMFKSLESGDFDDNAWSDIGQTLGLLYGKNFKEGFMSATNDMSDADILSIGEDQFLDEIYKYINGKENIFSSKLKKLDSSDVFDLETIDTQLEQTRNKAEKLLADISLELSNPVSQNQSEDYYQSRIDSLEKLKAVLVEVKDESANLTIPKDHETFNKRFSENQNYISTIETLIGQQEQAIRNVYDSIDFKAQKAQQEFARKQSERQTQIIQLITGNADFKEFGDNNWLDEYINKTKESTDEIDIIYADFISRLEKRKAEILEQRAYEDKISDERYKFESYLRGILPSGQDEFGQNLIKHADALGRISEGLSDAATEIETIKKEMATIAPIEDTSVNMDKTAQGQQELQAETKETISVLDRFKQMTDISGIKGSQALADAAGEAVTTLRQLYEAGQEESLEYYATLYKIVLLQREAFKRTTGDVRAIPYDSMSPLPSDKNSSKYNKAEQRKYRAMQAQDSVYKDWWEFGSGFADNADFVGTLFSEYKKKGKFIFSDQGKIISKKVLLGSIEEFFKQDSKQIELNKLENYFKKNNWSASHNDKWFVDVISGAKTAEQAIQEIEEEISKFKTLLEGLDTNYFNNDDVQRYSRTIAEGFNDAASAYKHLSDQVEHAKNYRENLKKSAISSEDNQTPDSTKTSMSIEETTQEIEQLTMAEVEATNQAKELTKQIAKLYDIRSDSKAFQMMESEITDWMNKLSNDQDIANPIEAIAHSMVSSVHGLRKILGTDFVDEYQNMIHEISGNIRIEGDMEQALYGNNNRDFNTIKKIFSKAKFSKNGTISISELLANFNAKFGTNIVDDGIESNILSRIVSEIENRQSALITDAENKLNADGFKFEADIIFNAFRKQEQQVQETAQTTKQTVNEITKANQRQAQSTTTTTSSIVADKKQEKAAYEETAEVAEKTADRIKAVNDNSKKRLIATEDSDNVQSKTYQDTQTGRTLTTGFKYNKKLDIWEPFSKELTKYTQLEKEAITYTNQLADAEAKLAQEKRKSHPDALVENSLEDQILLLESRLEDLYKQALNYHKEQGLGTEYTYQQFLDSVSKKTDEHSASLSVKIAEQIRSEHEANARAIEKQNNALAQSNSFLSKQRIELQKIKHDYDSTYNAKKSIVNNDQIAKQDQEKLVKLEQSISKKISNYERQQHILTTKERDDLRQDIANLKLEKVSLQNKYYGSTTLSPTELDDNKSIVKSNYDYLISKCKEAGSYTDDLVQRLEAQRSTIDSIGDSNGIKVITDHLKAFRAEYATLVQKQRESNKAYDAQYSIIETYRESQAELDKLLSKQAKLGTSNELEAQIKAQQKEVDTLKLKAIDASKELTQLWKSGAITWQQNLEGKQLFNKIRLKKTDSSNIVHGVLDDQKIKHDLDRSKYVKQYESLGLSVDVINQKLSALDTAYTQVAQSANSSIDARMAKELAYQKVLQDVQNDIESMQQAEKDKTKVDNETKRLELLSAKKTNKQTELLKLKAELIESGKMSAEVQERFEQLVNSLSNVSSNADLSIWNEQLKIFKSSIKDLPRDFETTWNEILAKINKKQTDELNKNFAKNVNESAGTWYQTKSIKSDQPVYYANGRWSYDKSFISKVNWKDYAKGTEWKGALADESFNVIEQYNNIIAKIKQITELRKHLRKYENDTSGADLSDNINETSQSISKLIGELKVLINEDFFKNNEEILGESRLDTFNQLYDQMEFEDAQLKAERKKRKIASQKKNLATNIDEQKKVLAILNDAFKGQQLDENTLFKDVSIDKNGNAIVTFLELVGNQARETKIILDDVYTSIEQIQSADDGFSFNGKQTILGSWRKTRESDRNIFASNETERELLKQIEAYEFLIKTEDKYQKMRAQFESGKLSSNQSAEFELLRKTRDHYNDSIKETINLTEEEQNSILTLLRNNFANAYQDQQEKSKHTYDAYMDQFFIGKEDPRYTSIEAALKQTKQFTDSLLVKKGNGLDSVFANAQLEIDGLNKKLQTGAITVDQYVQSIKKIKENLNNTVALTDSFNIEQGKNSMKAWIMQSFPTAEIGEFDQETKSLTYTIKDNGRIVKQMALVYDEATGQIKNMSVATVNITDKFDQFKQSIGQSSNSIFSYIRNAIDITSMMMYLRQGFTMVKEIDQSLTEMRKVSDESYQSLKRYQDLSFDIAGDIGTTANQIQASTADYMRLGYDLSVSKDLAKDANIYANVGDMDIDTATEHMISSIQAWKSEFSNEVEASGAIIDRYNEIGNNFAITSADIGSAMERSAAALKAGGNTLNESLGLITAGNVIQQDADTTANALKVMSLRIRGSKTELEEMGEETDGLASSTSKLREEIKALSGVDIMLDDNTYKSTARIIQEIGAVMPQLSDVSQAALLEKLAGKTRASVVAGLLENYKIIGEVIESAENAEGSALRENERYIDSITGKLSQATNEVQEILYNLFSTDIVKGVLSFGTTALDVIGDILEGLGSIGTAIVAITGYSKINKFLDKIEGKTTGESISGGRDKELSLCK